MEETNVVWSKDDREISIEESTPGKYELLKGGHALFIDDLSVVDNGMYKCSVKTPFETIGATVTLRVSGEAPKILSNLKTITSSCPTHITNSSQSGG